MKKELIAFVLTMVFVCCTNQKYDKQMPADFSFKIVSETDSYDSRTGIYIRIYIKKDSVVKAVMTQKEMEIVYELFRKNDFMSFPVKFECDKTGSVAIPAFETTVEMTYKGLHKRVINSTFCEKKIEQQKSERFDRFSSEIRNIIFNKKEIKNMRESNMCFM